MEARLKRFEIAKVVLTIALLFGFSSLTISNAIYATADASDGQALSQATIMCENSMPNSTIAGSLSLFLSSVNSAYDVDPGSELSLTNATQVAEAAFWGLCHASPSANVFASSTGNASLGLYAVGSQPDDVLVNFSTSYVYASDGTPQLVQVWWSLDVANGSDSGRYISEQPAAYFGPLANNSTNWAGYAWWYNTSAGSRVSLTGEAATTNVTKFYKPACCQFNVPPDHLVDPVNSVWTGLGTLNATGQSYIVQTGYVYDSKVPTGSWCLNYTLSCDYGLWWEYLPNPAHSYTGLPRASLNDILVEQVVQTSGSPGVWHPEILDETTLQSWMASVSTPVTMTYADFIVEAPTLNVTGYPPPHIQQTSEFNNVSFDSGVAYYGTSSFANDITMYQKGWYINYTLNQMSGYLNTRQFFGGLPINSCLDFQGHQTLCAKVFWLNSEYDYNYV
jgi:hypothetical protein